MAKLKPNQFYLPSGALITEHSILFKTEMVKANLEDRKTMTRRTKGLDQKDSKYGNFKLEGVSHFYGNVEKTVASFRYYPAGEKSHNGSIDNAICPYGKPGDLLYVRETWCQGPTRIHYAASVCNPKVDKMDSGWEPSIYLPKSGSRIWAMIEDIRVERVQEISEADAKAEGIMEFDSQNPGLKDKMFGLPSFKIFGINRKVAFKNLWASINGQASWDANPWVWVIKYRILSNTGRPSMDVIEQAYSEICNPKSEILNTPTP